MGDEARNIPKAIRITRAVAEYLSLFGSGKCEDAVRKSAHFRQWMAKRQK